jgi:hypothetical protein
MCDGYGRCIHDNLVLRYTVDRVSRTLRIETSSGDPSAEYTDVLFHDVMAYVLENDSLELGTILDGIEKRPGTDALKWSPEAFESGRAFAWPGWWNESADKAKEHIESSGMHAFEISSSIGLSGWVLASKMDLLPGGAPAPMD